MRTKDTTAEIDVCLSSRHGVLKVEALISVKALQAALADTISDVVYVDISNSLTRREYESLLDAYLDAGGEL